MSSTLGVIAERHRTRADLYAAVGRLLRHPPAPDDLAVLRAVLARHRGNGEEANGPRPLRLLRELVAAPDLAAAGHEYRTRLVADSVDLVCERSYSAAPDAAYQAVGMKPSADKVRELEVLAALNQRAAEAALRGNAAEAQRLGALERRYLSAHAGICLDTLAGQLRKDDGFYGKVGLVLETLLEDEIRSSS